MEILSTIVEFVQTPVFAGVVAGLLLISESLASIPSIQANSIFQAMMNGLKSLARKP